MARLGKDIHKGVSLVFLPMYICTRAVYAVGERIPILSVYLLVMFLGFLDRRGEYFLFDLCDMFSYECKCHQLNSLNKVKSLKKKKGERLT